MKAEHRKELETNTLADKMGQVMNRVKGSPRRAFFIYLVVAVIVSAGLWYLYRSRIITQQSQSEAWAELYDGSPSFLTKLSKNEGEPVGKAARLQFAWHLYWDLGIKMIGNNPRQSMLIMERVSKEYKELAKECKDDPVFEPEALLMIAVVEETKAVQDTNHLERATELYKDLLTRNDKKYEKSAQGKFAQGRLDHLEDTKKRAEVASLYRDLQKAFGVQAGLGGAFQPPFKKDKELLPPNHP